MEKIQNTNDLKAAIIFLEIKQANEKRILIEQFKATYESMKPVNIIKNTIKELITAPDLKNNLVNTTIGIATGYLSKKITIGSSHNPLKQALGALLQFGVTNIVSKNASGIKSGAHTLLNTLLNKKIHNKGV
ncbi:MAG: hypothetical protein Q7W45_09705 [Bacteroidota bacterium]|nr:hypothetical protein [Bacteroidota bacterium]MDP3144045.1 hypothetical protein [Bacteroidota bacterium]